MRYLRAVPLVSALLSLPSWADETLIKDLIKDQVKLTGIAAYDVLVEDLKPDADQCDVSIEQLKTQPSWHFEKTAFR
jgi:hypothetical protein